LPCQSTSPRLASRSIDLETGSDAAPEPASYAKLIYSTLLSAPEHKLRLQGIYWWFMENTTKPKDVNSTSWKSSVRYNPSNNPLSRVLTFPGIDR
jgi:hypothetical protein